MASGEGEQVLGEKPSSLRNIERSPSLSSGENAADKLPKSEEESQEKLSIIPEMPSGIKLVVVISCVCLSVFIQALVSCIY